MSMIDDIKRDREAGTPGGWQVSGVRSKIEAYGHQIDSPSLAGVAWVGYDDEHHAACLSDARRIARLPDLEAKYIALKEAADELAEAVKAATDYASDASNGHLWFVTKKEGRDALVRLSMEEGQQDLNTFKSALARYREASQ